MEKANLDIGKRRKIIRSYVIEKKKRKMKDG